MFSELCYCCFAHRIIYTFFVTLCLGISFSIRLTENVNGMAGKVKRVTRGSGRERAREGESVNKKGPI